MCPDHYQQELLYWVMEELSILFKGNQTKNLSFKGSNTTMSKQATDLFVYMCRNQIFSKEIRSPYVFLILIIH